MMFDLYIRSSLIVVGYTVSIHPCHFMRVSCKSILDDQQEGIDGCLEFAPNLSAMKVKYLEDSYSGYRIQDNKRVYDIFEGCNRRCNILEDHCIWKTTLWLRIYRQG